MNKNLLRQLRSCFLFSGSAPLVRRSLNRREFAQQVLERVQHEVEKCDYLGGFLAGLGSGEIHWAVGPKNNRKQVCEVRFETECHAPSENLQACCGMLQSTTLCAEPELFGLRSRRMSSG